jgi:hypothetical protein
MIVISRTGDDPSPVPPPGVPMRRITKIATIAPLAIGLTLGAALPAAQAGDDDITVQGRCSGSTNADLKLSDEDGRIEAEFEVDQNVNGRRWRVTMFHNGTRVERRIATTVAPSGSFEVREVVNNASGRRDVVRARAVDLRSGEVCSAVARW